MKKHIIILSMVAATIPSFAARTVSGNDNNTDTVLSVKNPEAIVITESPKGIEVSVKGNDNGNMFKSTFSQDYGNETKVTSHISSIPVCGPHRRNSWTLFSNGLHIGWVSADGQPASLGVEMDKSWEIGWLNIIGIDYTFGYGGGFSLGFGLDWRNYKITTAATRFIPTKEGVGISPYPKGVTPINSRLKVFTMGVPIMYNQPICHMFGTGFSMSLGVVLNYSSHGSMLTRWYDKNGDIIKESTNKIGHRRFSYDLMGYAGWGKAMGVYARFSPMTVLDGEGLPKFRSLSVGIIVGL